MTAPVNPEGQTARDVIKAAKRLVEGKYPHWTMAGGENDCPHGYAAGIPCERCDTRLVREFDAAQPSEGQTAQEVRRAALEEAARVYDRTEDAVMNCRHVAQFLRRLAADPSLASTPSPAATATPATTDREVVDGRRSETEGTRGAVQEDEARGGAPNVPEVRPEVRDPKGAARSVHGDRGVPLVQARADRGGVAPSPAKQEQKIASAEGAALKSGAAPATTDGTWPADCVQRAFVRGAAWWQFKANGSTAFPSERDEMEDEATRRYGDPLAPAQPDARDAEIAWLREQLEAWKLAKGAGRMQAEITQLTKELEEARLQARKFYLADGSCLDLDPAEVIARRKAAATEAKDLREALEFARRLPMAKKNRAILTAALAPPEPKAETPAETAGQKEGP